MPKLVDATSSNKGKKTRKKRFEYTPAELAELKQLGRGILLAISQSGKSSEKFAYENGLSKGHLSRIFRGQADIRFTTLRTISKGLGFKSVAAFLTKIL